MTNAYVQTNLVSDIAGLATFTDSELVNPWGVSFSSASPFWVSNTGTDTSTLYAVTVTGPTGIKVAKTIPNGTNGNVVIPPASGSALGPTGQVNNGFSATDPSFFLVGNGGDDKAAHFIFANLNGTISAWDAGQTAFIQVTTPATPGAHYTGLATSQNLTQPLLYAANDVGTTGSIDVFDSSWAPVAPGVGGLAANAFATPATIAASGLVPFNVQDISGNVYVEYAPGGPAANRNFAALGQGAVAVFTESGALETQMLGGVGFIDGGNLASPWGIALAPAGWGQFGGDLLVGNFSFINSEINAFNPTTGAFVGTIPINDGNGNGPGGLWALDFGIGGSNGSSNTLYFTDGINGEKDGLFGAITYTNYVQTDLVSDIAGLATVTDPELKNPWGNSFSLTSPFWISNQATNTSTLYAVKGTVNVTKNATVVAIPQTTSGPQGPTGQVANTNNSATSTTFLVNGAGTSAHFIFANLNGTISAWNSVATTGATAIIEATTAGAVYTGLAINQAQTELYAANNVVNGTIDVFDSSWDPVSLGAGAFATPAAISALGLDPFNVQDINGNVYVTYALPGSAQNSAALGQGAVAEFTESGTLEQTIVGSPLASPWGVALAPTTFGQFGGDLLVGNFSYLYSEINAFDPTTGAFVGTIPINNGSGNGPGGLWALDFGNGGTGSNGDSNTLYFTDGINGQQDGLIGAITYSAFAVDDLTANVQTTLAGTPYAGPVAGLDYQFIESGADKLNVAPAQANTFIYAGGGFDAIDVSHVGGTNVLDGGTNSDFLVGGTGAGSSDTFFVDDRGPSADIWSTVANFHSGDSVTIWGITPSGFTPTWEDGQGATGYTGLTLHETAPGMPTASLTLTGGYTTADLTNGQLTTSYGMESDGTPYLYIHAN